MTDMTRVQAAEAIAAKVGGKVWTSDNLHPEFGKVRVYVRKGYAEINDDGINLNMVGGHEFSGVKSAAEAIGATTYRR